MMAVVIVVLAVVGDVVMILVSLVFLKPLVEMKLVMEVMVVTVRW